MNYIRTKLDQLKLISAPVILLLIAIWACLSAILAWVMWSVGFAVWTSAKMSMLVSLLAWSYVVLKTPVFDWFFINVEANWVVILANHLKRDKQVSAPTTLATGEKDPRTEMRTLQSLREIPGPGFYGKLPWERQFESVDMRNEVIIGNTPEKPLVSVTSDNVTLFVSWRVILTPIAGRCTFLARRGEDATQSFFEGQFQQAILKWIKKNKEEAIASKLMSLNRAFENVFEGPNRISKTENDYGVYTNTPQITGITRSKGFQDAAEGRQVGNMMADIIKTVKDALGDKADPNMVAAIAAAIVGKNVEGLFLVPGLGNNPDALEKMMALAGRGKTSKKGTK